MGFSYYFPSLCFREFGHWLPVSPLPHPALQASGKSWPEITSHECLFSTVLLLGIPVLGPVLSARVV